MPQPTRPVYYGLTLALALMVLVGFVPHPAPALPFRPTDQFLSDQAAALRPEQRGDLALAEQWDRYQITLSLLPAERRARGTLRLTLTNRTAAPYERLYFRLYPNHADYGGRLDVTGARIAGRPAASGTEQRDTLIWLALPQPLAPGASTVAELDFVARTPRNASANSFGAFNQEAGLWSLAGFYPMLARQRGAEGWDRRPLSSRGDFAVSDTALYDVTVTAPTGWNLVSTGVRVGLDPLNGGLRRERFVSGPQREFYLGATNGLDQASSTVDGVRVVSHYQRSNPEAGRRALQYAEAALRAFNQRYGQYPLAELEVLQGAMTTFLGMEYPGVVLIDQGLYRREGRLLETTVVHEVAHQWWYSLVGNDAQSEPWLDEGLSSYAQVLYYEQIGAPELAAAELEAYRATYRRLREQGRDVPLGTPPAGLRGIYVPVIYAKGALFFHALRGQIGEEAFARFLNHYYTQGRYGFASGPDLLLSAETACSCDLASFYAAWVTDGTSVPIP
ncbi:MAG: M1 family metallopeptidase [Oscillochloridaceae bacterium umkhey_bin13]